MSTAEDSSDLKAKMEALCSKEPTISVEAALPVMKWIGIDSEFEPSLAMEAIKRSSLRSYNPKENEIPAFLFMQQSEEMSSLQYVSKRPCFTQTEHKSRGSSLRSNAFLDEVLHIIDELLRPGMQLDLQCDYIKAHHLGHIYPKLYELLQIFQSFGSDSQVSCLVFVKRINTASPLPYINGDQGNLSHSVIGSECNLVHFANSSVRANDLQDMLVLAIHTGGICSIIQVAGNKSAKSAFEENVGAATSDYSYAEYFKIKYGIAPVYPGQPLVRSKLSHNPHNLLDVETDYSLAHGTTIVLMLYSEGAIIAVDTRTTIEHSNDPKAKLENDTTKIGMIFDEPNCKTKKLHKDMVAAYAGTTETWNKALEAKEKILKGTNKDVAWITENFAKEIVRICNEDGSIEKERDADVIVAGYNKGKIQVCLTFNPKEKKDVNGKEVEVEDISKKSVMGLDDEYPYTAVGCENWAIDYLNEFCPREWRNLDFFKAYTLAQSAMLASALGDRFTGGSCEVWNVTAEGASLYSRDRFIDIYFSLDLYTRDWGPALVTVNEKSLLEKDLYNGLENLTLSGMKCICTSHSLGKVGEYEVHRFGLTSPKEVDHVYSKLEEKEKDGFRLKSFSVRSGDEVISVVIDLPTKVYEWVKWKRQQKKEQEQKEKE